jgi:mycobactin lysine-N-oxygenase
MSAARASTDLVVIGAGPKAVAIAVKAHVLNELGYERLRVTLVEQHEVAASWTGGNGFTTGLDVLGTRPEKDLGFPYQSSSRLGDQRIDAAMFRFSWQSHLVQIGEYRRWVDTGASPPTHREVARYLSWALSRATQGVQLQMATVTGIDLDDEGWRVQCETMGGARETLLAQRGLVLTGAGIPRLVPYPKEVAHRIILPSMTPTQLESVYLVPNSRVCIVGSGESAVTIALALARRYGDDLELTFVAPTLPYSRAESFLENSVYSDPQLVAWGRLAEEQRHEFVRRTDRGVMSPAALAQLARHRRLSFVIGRVRELQLSCNGLAKVVVDQPEEVVRQEFDAVAICIGSSPWGGLMRLLGDSRVQVEARIGGSLNEESTVIRQLDGSFALRGLAPRLHLPALAGLLHGPGFANLSCLGSLSDCILSAYVSRPQPNGETTVSSNANLLRVGAR